MGRKTIFTIITLLFLVCTMHAEAQRNVQLKSGGAGYTAKTFSISGVRDDRTDKDNVGEVRSGGKNEQLLMQNGAAGTLDRYIAANLRQDKAQQPAVELRIKKLDCDIRRKGSYWHIECTVNFAFYYEGEMLAEYDGGGHGDMNTDPADYAGGFIRQTLDADLKKFDMWWAQNKAKVATSSAVSVKFIVGRVSEDPDLIVYSARRPLRISDFEGRVRESQTEIAETSSGNKYAFSAVTKNGQIVVTYTITPYFFKSDSWFRQSPDNAQVLAHEQLHFDITALKTCEFISRMRSMTYTKDNYRKLLDAIPDQLAKETSDMQQQYDTEGNHGLITAQQLLWEAKVKALLAQIDCYH